MFSHKILCVLLFAVPVSFVSAQDANKNDLDDFSAKFISVIRANEKPHAFLVTDKSVFKAGEYVWFRAFLLNTVSQKQSHRSRFLFVDVVNDKDDVVKLMIMDAAGGQLNSRLQLPDSLPAGYYWLRAYTKQMAEHDPDCISVRPLYVSGDEGNNNPVKPKKITVNPDELPVINFYPEGGNIITGINSTVALQAAIKNGEPIGIEGYVKDNTDAVVTKFTTNSNGLARFDFEPSWFKKYRAVINWHGKDISYPLPPFNFFGGQLGVTKQKDNYKFRILLGDSIYSKEALSYVVGISKDSLVFAAIGKGQYEINVDANKLPQGIATFYLFDRNFKPLSERSIYVNANRMNINIAADKNIYAKRDKVTLDLSIADAEQHNLSSSITVSVSDSLLNSKDQCHDIDMLFKIQHIDNVFLSNNNCFSDDDLDLVMLTKSNTYQTLTKAIDQPVKDADDSLLFIRGRLLNDKKEPSSNKVVTLFSNGGNNGVFITDTTDNSGNFSFPLDIYPDNTQFAIEVKDLNNRILNNTNIVIDSLVYPKLKTPAAFKQYLTTASRSSLERMNTYNEVQWPNAGAHELPAVTVKENLKADYDESKRVSSYSTIIGPKDLDGRTSVDMLMQRVSGVQIMNGFLIIHGLNALRSPSASSEPLLLVEGAPVATSPDGASGISSPVMSYLHNLSPKDIDFIEILKDGNAANYGVRGANGVILINLTNRGRDINTPDNMKIFYAKGVTNPALFSITNYDVKNKKTAFPPDGRSTIFWNGNYLTGDAGRATFTFYTSDVPSTYNITVTGHTVQGDIINKTITVKSR